MARRPIPEAEECQLCGSRRVLILKVLHVITGLGLGGAEGVLTRLVLATRPEFEHVVVSLQDEGYFGPMLRSGGVDVHTIGMGAERNAISGLVRLTALVRRIRPAVVQTWLYHADVVGGIAARLAGVRPVIWGVRNTNLDVAAISRSTRLVARAGGLLSWVVPQAIIYNSVESARVHRAFGYRSGKSKVIPNGFDLDRFRPDSALRAAARKKWGLGENTLVLGCVARWDPQKDHTNLIAALRPVMSRRADLCLLLVGSGMDSSNDRLISLLRNAGIMKQVVFCGARDDVPSVMNAMDIHVLASLGEAFPNVVAEAMACGVPCVVTDVGDAAYIVGDTGWVAPPCDHHALGVSILAALAALERQPRSILAGRCRARIADLFSLARMTAAYRHLWSELGMRP